MYELGRAGCAVLLAALVGCGGGGREVVVEPEADAGGVAIRASSRTVRDSIRVAAEITNMLDTTADLILDGACPVTLFAYEGERLLWDEGDAGLECAGSELPVPLAPGEVETISHAVPESALAGIEIEGPYRIGVRVRLAQGPEYVLDAPARE